MEHRWNTRKPIRINVVVHSSASGLVSGKTRDLSAGGLFIETAPGVQVDPNTVVRVGFMVRGELKIAPGLVARSGEQGFGLMFTELNSETLAALEKLMRAGNPAAEEESTTAAATSYARP